MTDQPSNTIAGTIFIVDDDPAVRDSLSQIVRAIGLEVRLFESAEHFLKDYRPGGPGCLVLDVRMSGMDGITLYEKLVANDIGIPTIVITGHGDVSLSVRAMKNGVVDFFEKPCEPEQLIDAIRVAIELDLRNREQRKRQATAEAIKAKLSEGEFAVMEQIVAGRTNKEIGISLDVSLRTVQFRRASVMRKLEVGSRAELVELVHQRGDLTHIISEPEIQTGGLRHLSVHAGADGPGKSHALGRLVPESAKLSEPIR